MRHARSEPSSRRQRDDELAAGYELEWLERLSDPLAPVFDRLPECFLLPAALVVSLGPLVLLLAFGAFAHPLRDRIVLTAGYLACCLLAELLSMARRRREADRVVHLDG